MNIVCGSCGLDAAEVARLTAERDRLRDEWRDADREKKIKLQAAHAEVDDLRAERDEARASLAAERERNKRLRVEVLRIARARLAEAVAYRDKWCDKPNASDWDKGFAAGLESAAHAVANSINRPRVITEHAEQAALRDAVVEALRPLVAASKQSTAPRTPAYQAVIAALDALDAGAATEPDRLVIGHDGRGGRVIVEENGVHLVCPVCGFDQFPEGGMHAAYSIHLRDHERKGWSVGGNETGNDQ